MGRRFSRFTLVLAFGGLMPSLSAQAPGDMEKELLDLLNTPVQGASKREQRLIDSPQAVEVITGDELRQQGIYRLQDALKLMTSVDLLESDNGYSVIGLRGVMQDGQPRTVQVLVDGVPQYSTIGAAIDISNLPVPLELIDKVEVVRGPSSTLYGANAVTGVISITTRKPDKGLTGLARISRADKGTTRGGALMLLGQGDWGVSAGYQGYSMGASGFETHYIGRPTQLRSYSDQPGSTTTTANPWIGSDAGHGSQAMARGQYQKGGTTAWLSAGRSDKWYGPEGYFAYRQSARTTLLGGWRQAWTEGFSTEVRVHQLHAENHLSSSSFLAIAFEDPGFQSDYNWADTRTTQLEIQANWTVLKDLFLVAGLDTRRIETGKSPFNGLATGAKESASGGFLAMDWRALPQFTVSLGARVENESLGGSRTSPRLAMVWNPIPSGALRAGYYTSTRSPQILEQRVDLSLFSGQFSTAAAPTFPLLPVYGRLEPNPNLKPEKTTNLEVGYRQSIGAFSMDLTLYQMKFSELITVTGLGIALQPGPTTPPFVGTTFPARFNVRQQFQNAGNATNEGAELAITWAIRKGWTAGANMTLLTFTRDQASGVLGDQFAYTTRKKGNVWFRMHQGAFTGFAAVQAVGGTTAEGLTINTNYFEPRDKYIQWHANAAYEFWQGLSAGLYVRNGAKEFTLQGSSSPDRQTPYQAMRREIGATFSYRF